LEASSRNRNVARSRMRFSPTPGLGNTNIRGAWGDAGEV
jgi:hypothetical protein